MFIALFRTRRARAGATLTTLACLFTAAALAQLGGPSPTVSIKCISVSNDPTGVDLHRFSELPAISQIGANGDLWIAFSTAANNLQQQEPPLGSDVSQFDVYSMHLDGAGVIVPAETTRVSFRNSMNPNPYSTNTRPVTDTDPNGGSSFASISDDGMLVAFQSRANLLVPNTFNADTNPTGINGFQNINIWDIFLADLTNPANPSIVQVSGPGMTGDPNNPVTFTDGNSRYPAISGDGAFVVFSSKATNLGFDSMDSDADIVRYDVINGTMTAIKPVTSKGTDLFPSVSTNGRWIAFESETPKGGDFGGDASMPPTDPNTSSPGRGQDIFLADMFYPDMPVITAASVTDTNGEVTGNMPSRFPAISAGGDYIAFVSLASDLDQSVDGNNQPVDVNSQPDVYVRTCPPNILFVRDCALGDTVLVSVDDATGKAPMEPSGCAWCRPAIYHNAQTGIVAVAFASLASFDPLDTNGAWDIYVRVMCASDLTIGDTYLVSQGVDFMNQSVEANLASFSPSMTGVTIDATTTQLKIAFASYATNLENSTPDNNEAKDVFLATLSVTTPTCP